jgi:hypothetical protein
MLSGSWSIHSSIVWRATYVASILLVFFYILFDVLDLDGSSFPRLMAPMKRPVIVAVVPSGAHFHYSPEQSKLGSDISLRFTERSAEYSRPPWAELLKTSSLGTARSHGYRVGLARNSLPD